MTTTYQYVVAGVIEEEGVALALVDHWLRPDRLERLKGRLTVALYSYDRTPSDPYSDRKIYRERLPWADLWSYEFTGPDALDGYAVFLNEDSTFFEDFPEPLVVPDVGGTVTIPLHLLSFVGAPDGLSEEGEVEETLRVYEGPPGGAGAPEPPAGRVEGGPEAAVRRPGVVEPGQ